MAVADQFQFVDNNQDVRIAGSLVDQGATEGDVLTVNADGSISAAPGGGSLPGVGDFVQMEADAAGAIPSDGASRVFAMDSGIIQSGGSSITLSEDQKTVTVAYAGIYAITLVLDFAVSDQTGRRAARIYIVDGLGTGGTFISGSPGTADLSPESNVCVSLTCHLPAAGTVQFEAVVNDAAGAVNLDFAQAYVCRVA